MRVIVTGANGFVGTHLTRFFAEESIEVSRLGRSSGVDVVDRDAVARFFADHQADWLVHLAGQSDIAASWTDPVGTQRVNVEGTMNVLGGAADADVKRILVVSSAAVYGHVSENLLPIFETSPPRPFSPYAASKLGAEAIAHMINHISDSTSVVIARPFNHIGVGQRPNFVASGFANRIARVVRNGGRSIQVGDLTPTRDFLDVADVIRAYRLLIEEGRPGEIYNVCSGIETSIESIARMLIEESGEAIELAAADSLLRPAEIPRMCGSNAKLRELGNWRPTIELRASLRDVYAAAAADESAPGPQRAQPR